jgi:predicted enzyme related to lactoylglutathione lyase
MGDIEYTTWRLNGNPVGGMVAMAEQVPAQVPAHWLAYFAVEDADATAEKAKAAGANLMFGPMDIPAGRFAVLADPHGAVFGVVRMS